MTADPVPEDDGPAGAPAGTGSRVRGLHPGWFASVMATGIFAVATYSNPGNISALSGAAHALGSAVAVVAYVLGIVLVFAYAQRWIQHTDAALDDLRHPIFGGMHATLPGGLLVLAVMTSVVGPSLLAEGAIVPIVAVLTAVGSVLALILAVAFGLSLFTSGVAGEAVNGVWFIPPVVTVIIALALAPLVPHTSGEGARLLIFLGFACLGMGFILFLLVLALLFHRLVLHPLPPAPLAPTLWIALGPVAVSALAPLALSASGQQILGPAAAVADVASRVFSAAIWGFGLWWLAIAVALLVRYLRAGGVPFHLGWWSFVFPLGAYTVATITLARAWDLPVVDAFAAVLWVVLTALWGVVAWRTLSATSSGEVWTR